MSYDINIKNLEFLREEFTNCFFISSKKYTWQFVLENKPHKVVLLYTKLLGKRIIYLDDKEIYNSRKYTNKFILSFPIEFYNITITQKDYFYTLKINNISFCNILNDLKLKKFNILEEKYKEKLKKEKLRQLQKRKNKILEKTIKELFRKEKLAKYYLDKQKKENGLEIINEEIINTSNKFKEESINEGDSKTIHDSFEMHEKAFSVLDNKINNTYRNNLSKNNKDNNYGGYDNDRDDKNKIFKKKKSFKNFKKDKFKPSEKIKNKTYENINTSENEIIDIDIIGDDQINSEARNTNIFRNNIFSSNNRSFFDKGSLTTQSN